MIRRFLDRCRSAEPGRLHVAVQMPTRQMLAEFARPEIVSDLVSRAACWLFAAAALLLLSPLILLLALTVKITSPGPVFLSDQRLGRGGRTCRVYRFRAGVSERESASLTPVGEFLRETRLEQLPQLWNVLRGDFFR
jgi:lipopolysaccharide/colanic/teichoic acid biosynthesis glycosyltransferase